LSELQFGENYFIMPSLHFNLENNPIQFFDEQRDFKLNKNNYLFDMDTNEMQVNKLYRIDDDLALVKTKDDEVYIVDIEPEL